MTIREIITNYLKDNGYDGLYNPEWPCSCDLDDLAPCAASIFDCISGYKGPCDCGEGCRFHICAKKPKGD